MSSALTESEEREESVLGLNKQSSFILSPRGSRPPSIHAAAGGAEQGAVEHAFYTLGLGIGRWAGLFLSVTALACAGLTAGIVLRGKVDTDLFGSLVLRPKSRMQRETTYNRNRYDVGFNTASEVTNGVATRGGKDVLKRENLLQSARFWRDKDVMAIAVSDGGVTLTGHDVLSVKGGQPFRYTILDCWQEGSYDFFGSVSDLSPEAAPLEALGRAIVRPFYPAGAAVDEERITPYTYCLYMRLALLYLAGPERGNFNVPSTRVFGDHMLR